MKTPITDVDHLRNKIVEDDPVWHVQLAALAALILQITLPENFIAGPRYALFLLEALLLLSMTAIGRRIVLVKSVLRRVNSLSLVALIGLVNIFALQRLSHDLLVGGKINNGHGLILASFNIYLTNVIIFALLYWEIDGGGPARRHGNNSRQRDFVFSQMTLPEFVPTHWKPKFVDYLFLSGTNALAFSPTDTLPVTRSAKLLMLLQAFVSLTTIGLVAARAVNILS